jgi:hypothetical protein
VVTCDVCEHSESEVGPLREFAGHEKVCEDCITDIRTGRLK